MIRQAVPSDIEGINAVLSLARFPKMDERQTRDVCLVGVIDSKIRGVIWASVGDSRYQACVDYFAVDPQYKGLGVRLALSGLRMLRAMGVRKVIATNQATPERSEVLRVFQWMGMSMCPDLFNYGSGFVSEMRK